METEAFCKVLRDIKLVIDQAKMKDGFEPESGSTRLNISATDSKTGNSLTNLPGHGDASQHIPISTEHSVHMEESEPLSDTLGLFTAKPKSQSHLKPTPSMQGQGVAPGEGSPEFVNQTVTTMLNKLSIQNFDLVSAQIAELANHSVDEVDGHSLIQVTHSVFKHAISHAFFSEIYARLCGFLIEHISEDIRAEGVNDADGKPVSGASLFRKHLLKLCQDALDRGCSAQGSTTLAAPMKLEDENTVTGGEVSHLEEVRASQKAKRRYVGLLKFIGEIFKQRIIAERVVHECIKKLLRNVESSEEEIESLCMLLATAGRVLDTPKARNHMDIYFSRLQDLVNGGQVSGRIRCMLLDTIELREREWVLRVQPGNSPQQVTAKDTPPKQPGGRHGRRSARGGRGGMP